MNVIVLNCHDSFVFNLVQILRETPGCTPIVVDEEHAANAPELFLAARHILLSPGPGLPSEMAGLQHCLQSYGQSHSIFGVCLGMQALAEHFSARLEQLPRPKHGHSGRWQPTSDVHPIFQGLKNDSPIARYHSWIVCPDSLPEELVIDGYDEDGHIAALHHRQLPLYGVQFHPESVITQEGPTLIRHWLERTQ